jgi:hypothetical protein
LQRPHVVAPPGDTGARVRVADEPNDDTGLKPAPGSLPSPCQNEYVRVVPADLRLAGVLETVLYYASDQQDEMELFYENVLGLESLGVGRWSLAFRLGQGVVLLFDREQTSAQEEPPPHGASGSIHTAFLAAPGEYEAWKERLADRGVTLSTRSPGTAAYAPATSTIPPATCSRSRNAISGPTRRRQVPIGDASRSAAPPGVSSWARARAEVSCRTSAKKRQPLERKESRRSPAICMSARVSGEGSLGPASTPMQPDVG